MPTVNGKKKNKIRVGVSIAKDFDVCATWQLPFDAIQGDQIIIEGYEQRLYFVHFYSADKSEIDGKKVKLLKIDKIHVYERTLSCQISQIELYAL